MKTNNLEPVLIRKDEHLIKTGKEEMTRLVKDAQEVYDLFQTINIELTAKEVYGFLCLKTGANDVVDFVADKLVERAGKPDFNGIPIKKEKIRELVELPNTQKITDRLSHLQKYWGDKSIKKSIEVSDIEIKSGVVASAPFFDEKLGKKHTHYTETESGHALANCLLKISGQISELVTISGFNKNGSPNYRASAIVIPGLFNIVNELPKDKHYYAKTAAGETSIIISEFGGHKLNLDFIRAHERNCN